MAYLTREQRKQLENVVGAARTAAEAGARAELRRLHVHEAEPAVYLTAEDRELRVRLRARAKQLGDVQDTKLEQGFARMVHACAYEQWHRMLFARFLAERQLLMHPTGVAVTLQDCADLAADEGAADEWELAGRYAAAMLPQIFRPDDPLLAVRLADESRQKLEHELAKLGAAVFQGKDALGWVYQFWQAQKKQAINDSEVKIGADELPAVTQLFTEPYMVGFLLHNSLGAWWAGKVLAANPELAVEAQDEAELRAACGIAGVEWTYLRFVREEGKWRPAAGTFDGWPKKAAELKVLDPCCGSGHFLVGMLEILTALRAAEEGLGEAQACDAVLRDNLHGLEIDPRCTELAAFAVALAAWGVGGGGVRKLPELKIACSGLSLGVTKKEWLGLAEGRPELLGELEQLYFDFEKATVLGSLIQPRKAMGSLFETQADRLLDWLTERAKADRATFDAYYHELAVTAQGAAMAGAVLAGRFHFVATNVPYLNSGRLASEAKHYCDTNYPLSNRDLATMFLERCLGLLFKSGTLATVAPQNWLFLKSYAPFRRDLLARCTFNGLARLGAGAFETISGEVVKATLVLVGVERAPVAARCFAVDVAAWAEPGAKASALQTSGTAILQSSWLTMPDQRIIAVESDDVPLLSQYAETGTGVCTYDTPRFLIQFWEVESILRGWLAAQTTVRDTALTSGCTNILRWHEGVGDLADMMAAKLESGYSTGIWRVWSRFIGGRGVVVSLIGDLPATLYQGQAFDNNTGIIVAKNSDTLPAIWTFCSSPEFSDAVRRIDQKLNVTNATLAKIPFDLAHWTRVAAERYPNGLPPPYSSDPTQWLFNGHPLASDTPLQVAVARLCGYLWPRQTGSSFPDCPALPPDDLVHLADDDGIVCLPAVLGERPAADRLLDLLVTAYGPAWTPGTLPALLTSAGYANHDLDAYLRDAFFEHHCKQFQHRPFIWQIWDGERDGFSALINYHRLDHATLKKLTYTYLGDWIQRQDQAVRENRDGAQGRLTAAKNLQTELERILEGEAPLDIFVRWKPLAKQPIGWDPDLDDGVRLNIRPFLAARDVGKKDAGLLRWKPNIHWNKDRGKDVESAPWYKVFGGERINDHHLTLAEKRAAREKHT